MEKILEVKKLKISFRTNSGTLKAVRDISFDLEKGKTLAIVGESGSGKSVTSKAIIGILAGNSIVESGEILYDGKDLLRIPEDEMHRLRGDKIAMIFQDPLSSLNPIVKIGKQITEAMLLKNKASRRESSKEYNKTLELLRRNMLKASPVAETEHINQMVNTFRTFCRLGTKLENDYNLAESAAEEIISAVEDYSARVNSYKGGKDVTATVKGIAKRLPEVKDEFLTDGYETRLSEMASELSVAGDTVQAVTPVLKKLEDLMKEIISGEKPNFFRIGYSRMKDPNVSFRGRAISEVNEEALRLLNGEFMDEFAKKAEEGIRYSHEQALAEKKNVLAALKDAHAFYAGDFTRADGLALCKKLTEKVEKSIDRQEIVKDSAAYAFGVSLRHAVERFFTDQQHNRKEERRFAVQTKRRDAKIARGKTVDWKVVPKNIYELSDLHDNITTVTDRLVERYEAAIAADASVDFAARTVELIDYLKGKESQAVYRITKSMAREKAIKLMEEVGIHDPRTRYNQYPFEFSGGMRQRIVIAIALAANPDILICDEPTTALDVTIQAQILELINKLKKERNLSVIFITHDLGVVANMADDIAVMYAGKIIEYGTADDIFYDPRHPYTWALLSSMPDLETTEKLDAIPGTPPNMVYPPVGDAFADRNKYALKIDFEQQPPMFRISDTHMAATWLLHPNAPKVEMPRIITERIARMKKAGGEQHAE